MYWDVPLLYKNALILQTPLLCTFAFFFLLLNALLFNISVLKYINLSVAHLIRGYVTIFVEFISSYHCKAALKQSGL